MLYLWVKDKVLSISDKLYGNIKMKVTGCIWIKTKKGELYSDCPFTDSIWDYHTTQCGVIRFVWMRRIYTWNQENVSKYSKLK